MTGILIVPGFSFFWNVH